jgi:hypothetical protein
MQSKLSDSLNKFISFVLIFTILSSQMYAQEDMNIDLTLLGRFVSNKGIYEESPYLLALFETQYEKENYTIFAGMIAQSQYADDELPINSLYLDYYTDKLEFKIGKMVEKVGVLDHFSLIDTLNPWRYAFFYDAKLEVKRVPLWMSSFDYYLNDSIKLSAFAQLFDSRHQEYTGYYVNYILNKFIPQHYDEFFQHSSVGDTVISPLYHNVLSPFLSENIDAKKGSSEISLETTSFGLIAEYSDERKKIGVAYFNRYSEIPLIVVN